MMYRLFADGYVRCEFPDFWACTIAGWFGEQMAWWDKWQVVYPKGKD